MLSKDGFIVGKQVAEAVPVIVGPFDEGGIPAPAGGGANLVRSAAQDMKRVALHGHAREAAARVPHDGGVGGIRMRLDLLMPHARPSGMMGASRSLDLHLPGALAASPPPATRP